MTLTLLSRWLAGYTILFDLCVVIHSQCNQHYSVTLSLQMHRVRVVIWSVWCAQSPCGNLVCMVWSVCWIAGHLCHVLLGKHIMVKIGKKDMSKS